MSIEANEGLNAPDKLEQELQECIRREPHLAKDFLRMGQIETEILDLMPDPDNEESERQTVTFGQLRKIVQLVREEATLRAGLLIHLNE